ncbi:hypothetical protein [Paracraurococcus ruber]|uniref:Uncharacterized protein n=1 Tax=Paracraurococcus ruber TaxID=77675 RepID=A0ABS1CWT2_9PROT|nr:hypothetical protein [Paracraurococcus ruber]MBK1658870.1 hypothetical protein [Paracraurococcus ruber]TDG30195.1 hypothetical protein E2C05_15235 [Paracraurococcus ruber]
MDSTKQIWFGTRAVKFVDGGSTGSQLETIDDASGFATRTLSNGTFDFTGSEWRQLLAFTGTAAAQSALGINLADGVNAPAAGKVNDASSDLRVGMGVVAHNLADITGGGRVADISMLSASNDPVAITGHGKANSAVLADAFTEGAPSQPGNYVTFSDELGFGFVNGTGSEAVRTATRLNDGDSVTFALKGGQELTFASFTARVLNPAATTTIVLDSDGRTIRDTNGGLQGGFEHDGSAGELRLDNIADGTRVEIDFLARSITYGGTTLTGTQSQGFFDAAFKTLTTLTLGSQVGNQNGWSADDLVLTAAAAPARGSPAILTFDDIDLGGQPETPLGVNYGGFTWLQAGIVDADDYPQLGYRASSASQLAFVGEKNGQQIPGYAGEPNSPLVITRAEDFDAFGAQFSSAFGTQVVTARAYDDGILVGTASFTVAAGSTTSVQFADPAGRFASIDKLVLDAPGYFGFDDFVYAVIA